MKVRFSLKRHNPKYRNLHKLTQSLIILFGGGSSGKSRAVVTNFILYALRGEACLVARQTLASIRKSLWLETTKAIYDMGLGHLFKFNKSDFVIECVVSGGSLQYVGCEDIERVKSITPVHRAAFTKLHVEEATEIAKADLTQLRIRLRGRAKFKKQTYLTFNPIFKAHYLFKDYFEPIGWTEDNNLYEHDTLYIMKTTYKDNQYLQQDEIDLLEGLKETSPYFWNVYGLGNFGVLGSRVFDGNWATAPLNSMQPNLPVYIGLDFGFTNDPTAVSFMQYCKASKTIYIFDEIYANGMTNDVLAKAIKDRLASWGINPKQPVYCDSAEPKSIKELVKHGVNATKTVSKEINTRLDWMRQHTFIIADRCKNIREEFSLYTWVEKDGSPINKPIDKWNHGIDGTGYGLSPLWSGSRKIVGGRRTC